MVTVPNIIFVVKWLIVYLSINKDRNNNGDISLSFFNEVKHRTKNMEERCSFFSAFLSLLPDRLTVTMSTRGKLSDYFKHFLSCVEI